MLYVVKTFIGIVMYALGAGDLILDSCQNRLVIIMFTMLIIRTIRIHHLFSLNNSVKVLWMKVRVRMGILNMYVIADDIHICMCLYQDRNSTIIFVDLLYLLRIIEV